MDSKAIDSEYSEAKSQEGYEFIREIGSGGYGYVYLFRRKGGSQSESDYVAGKFVYRQIFGPPDDPSSGAAYQRALEGLQNFRSLSGQSQYLLRVFDVSQRHSDGYFCYMMELADDIESGRNIIPRDYKPKTLKNELDHGGKRHRLAPRKCVEIAIMLARGLQILHDAGFTHRDVRPSNIIFVNDVPKLADIDLLAGHDPALTSYIPKNYAAPEGSHSIQADIFSFGKTLYEMCTGFAVRAYPSLPPEIRYWEDHRLMLKINRIIAKASAPNQRKRYKSAAEMLNDLEQIH
jgi:eukaryotic-like serine/threonine-protein kinase